MTRAALYARVSTTDQHVGMQLEDLRELARVRGWDLVTEYTDIGVSGARERRPGLDALLGEAQRGRFEVLAVWKLDRLGRSLPHLLQVMAQLDQWGVKLVSARDAGIDTTTPAGRLLSQLLGAFAEFERDLLRERTIAGVRRAQARGAHCGRPATEITAEEVRAAIQLHGGVRPAARALGLAPATLRRRMVT